MKLRILELYSGIGGMHYAVNALELPDVEIVAAVDISPIPNSVYRHNFPSTTHMEKGIEGFSAKELDNFKFNMLLMSPPCQPFTRIGLKKDVNDPRSKSFLHLLKILPQMKNLPQYILLENVKGFEESKAYQLFCDLLIQLSFSYQGFLVSPKDLGIPNSRLRYYMLAKRKPLSFNKDWHHPEKILNILPPSQLTSLAPGCDVHMREKPQAEDDSDFKPRSPLRDYLEMPDGLLSEYRIPDRVVDRYLAVMDIVTPSSTNSTCFTKSYGHYVEGTGSVLNHTELQQAGTVLEDRKKDFDLRYFTPREIANLMCFPKTFTFPESTTRRQQYKVLGNSLNVSVVAHLLQILIHDEKPS